MSEPEEEGGEDEDDEGDNENDSPINPLVDALFDEIEYLRLQVNIYIYSKSPT